MITGFIDADRHVSEPLGMWAAYLPKSLHDHAPYLGETEHSTSNDAGDRHRELLMNGAAVLNKFPAPTREAAFSADEAHGNAAQKASNPWDQIQAMNETGVAVAALFPSLASYCVYNEAIEPHVSVAFAAAYNNWLRDYCAIDPHRLRGVALISRHAPETMCDELTRIATFGWRTVTIRPEPTRGRSIGHSDYEPFWAACADMGVSVAIHGGTHLRGPTAGTERFESRFALHACSHPMEAQMAFLSLLDSGVFERHPTLRVAFLESGASWVPHWLWRLDEICFKEMHREVRDRIKMKPSEYFQRHCWVGIELEEPSLREVVETIGADRLLYGTDYPHPDHLHYSTADVGQLECALTPEELRLTLESNPKTFYGWV